MNAAVITNANTRPSVLPGVARVAACLLVVLWAALSAVSAATLSIVEISNAAGLGIAVLLGLIVFRGPARMATSALGRVWTVGAFCAALVVLARSFQYHTAAVGQSVGWDFYAVAPVIISIGLWLSTRMQGAPERPVESGDDLFDKAERFLSSRSVRLNLAVTGVALAAIGLAASALPMRALVGRAVTVGVVVMALKPLLRLASTPLGARTINFSMLGALALTAMIGFGRYEKMWERVERGNSALTANDPVAGKTDHDQAAELNSILRSQSATISMEESWAQFYERLGLFWDSIDRWNRVADLRKIDRAEFLPLMRLQCKVGDSVTVWRRLVYEGFSAVNHPEIAPGIRTMADLTQTDARAKLLAALLAWDQDEAQDVRLRRLREVQHVAAGEPTSIALLRQMGEKPAEVPLWIPESLLVGSKATLYSTLGSISELGEVRTLVLLEKGHWDLNINARGTPLREEWPVIRVELDGQVIGRSQVNRAEDHNVGFSVDINRRNLYTLKIVFENRMEDMAEGRLSMRGVTINGIGLQHEKLP